MSSKEKPSLQGAKVKQRKGVAKATAKFEPQLFRESLLNHLNCIPLPEPQDKPAYLDSVAKTLDELGSSLDYRKYDSQLFEILLVSDVLSPGGSYLIPDGARSSFSIIKTCQEPVLLSDVKLVVEVLHKLIRRYKYLQKSFEETSLKSILSYLNKFSVVDQEKLSVSTSLFVSGGLVNASVLSGLKKDHLVKEGTSLRFLTSYIKAYLQLESLDHLSSSLRRTGNADLLQFFPANKRSPKEFQDHFNANGLKGIIDFDRQIRAARAKEDLNSKLKEMISDEESPEEIISVIKEQASVLEEKEIVSIIFLSLVANLDLLSSQADLIGASLLKQVGNYSEVLEVHSNTAKSQLELINTVQSYFTENVQLSSTFPKLLKLLISKDVVSGEALIYWYDKGKPNPSLATMAAPLVKFLKEQEEEEEE